MENSDTPVSEIGANTEWKLFKCVQDLLTCPVCGSFFSDTATEHSGNTFCRDCLAQKSLPPYLFCTNWKMKNMVQMAKWLKPFHEETHSILEEWCTKHQEYLSFFYRGNNEKICLVCRYSSLQEGHTLTPLQDLDTKQEAGTLDIEQSVCLLKEALQRAKSCSLPDASDGIP